MMKTNCWLILGTMIATSAVAQVNTNNLPDVPAPATTSQVATESVSTNAPAPAKKKAAPKKKAAKPAKKISEPTVALVPGPATVTSEILHLRGQAGMKGESVGSVKKGDTVTVISEITLDKHAADEPAQWAKVALPSGTKVWLNSHFVDKANNVVTSKKLNLRAGLRVVGDRKAAIRRVLLFPGWMTPAAMWQRYSEADMIVAGEVREWENTHYAADLFTAGEKRALVTIGRVVSEDPGMRVCAEWIKSIVKEVPAQWIGVGDPYWRPA